MKLIELQIEHDTSIVSTVLVNPEAVDVIVPHLTDDSRCQLIVGDDVYEVYMSIIKVRKLVEEGMNT